MKYFARYISVERKIDDGNYYISDRKDIFQNKNGTRPYNGDKKVNLFLCSRDIQFGDNAYSPRNGFYKFGYHENSYRNESIKVMGLISPGAIWIKEGDEFEEQDIDEVCDLDIDTLPRIFKILCPTCKTFH